MPPAKKKQGRPSVKNKLIKPKIEIPIEEGMEKPENAVTVVRELLRRLADGETLRDICKDEHMPKSQTVRTWCLDDPDGFHVLYMRARELGWMEIADHILEIADDGTNDWMEKNDPNNPGYELNGEHIRRTEQRIQTRKWMLSKMLPKVFGDKVEHQHEVDVKHEKFEEVRIHVVWPDDRRPDNLKDISPKEIDNET